jgi:hypothetical protein
VNIDIHDGGGVPTADYGAAGLPGVWNALALPSGIPESLVGLDGQPITATLTQTGRTGLQVLSNDELFGNDAALLSDRAVSFVDFVTLDFAGLTSGTYGVYTYLYSTSVLPMEVSINDESSTAQSVMTDWNGMFELGATHSLHVVDVLDGTMRISIEILPPYRDAFVSGVQLVRIPSPGAIPLLAIALAAPRRRSKVRASAAGGRSGPLRPPWVP